MNEASEGTSITFAGVVFSEDGIEVRDSRRVVQRVPRADDQVIEVRHGFVSAHPLVQVALGAALMWGGVYPARYVLLWTREGGTLSVVIALLVMMIPAGAWIVYDALKRGHYLRVRSRSRHTRLSLQGGLDDADIRAFVARARTELQLDIRFTMDDESV